MVKLKTYLTKRGHGFPKSEDFGEVEYKERPFLGHVVTINGKGYEVVKYPLLDRTKLPPPVTFNGQAPDEVADEVYVVER